MIVCPILNKFRAKIRLLIKIIKKLNQINMIDDNDIQKLGEVFATKNQIQEMFDKNNKK